MVRAGRETWRPGGNSGRAGREAWRLGRRGQVCALEIVEEIRKNNG